MTKEEFLDLRSQGFTFSEIGNLFDLTERQVNYRTKKWGLDFSKKKNLNEKFFSSKTKAAYYWAGFLAADGWIEKCRNRVGLALKAEDIKHLEKFKSAVSSSHDICPFMNNTAYRIRFNSETMVQDLENIFNITEAKTLTYRLPEFEEDYLMWEFFRGYIEGDGHLEKTASGRVALHLCSAVLDTLEQFKEYCQIYINRNITQKSVLNTNPKGSVYTLRFNLDDSRDIINLLYKNSTINTRLDRKFSIASLVIR